MTGMTAFLVVLIALILAGCSDTAIVVADAIAYGLNSHKTQDEIVDEILRDSNFASQYYGKSQMEIERMLGSNGCTVNRYGHMKYIFKTNTSAGNLRTTYLEFRFRNARCVSVKHWSEVENARPRHHNHYYHPPVAPLAPQQPSIVINNNNNQSATPAVFGPTIAPNNNNLMR